MPIAVNDSGDALFLSDDGQWKPAQTAVNPQTKERLAFDGKGWQPLKSQSTGSTGTGNAFAGGVISGVPILGPLIKGGAQRAAAGIRSFMYGTPMADELKAVQDYAEKSETEHPIANVAGEVTGGLASTGGAAATSLGSRLLGLTGTTLPGMMWRGAASGVGIGAADSMARGGDPVAGGAVSGLAGAVAPGVGRLASVAVEPALTAIRGIRDPVGEAARRVALANQRDITAGTAGLTPQEHAAAQAAGAPVANIDLGGEVTRDLARSAANTSPEGRAVLDRTINDRFEGQSNRLTDWLNSRFNFPNAPAQQTALANVARNVNDRAYAAARTAADQRFPGGIWSSELERLTSSPDVVDAMRTAAQRGAGRAVAEGYGGFNPGVTFDNGIVNFRRTPNGVPAYPDIRFWDYTYRNLRDSADAAFRAGRNSEGGALRTQANALRDHLDQMVPEFAQARAGAAQHFGAQDALEAGQNFVTSRMENREARAALAQMSPQERQLFQDGFVDRFVQQIRESPDRRSILNNIANSPAARERITLALGPQRANELEAMLRVEGVMDTARRAVQGNSTTARQLAQLGLAGGTYTLGTGGNILNPDPMSVLNATLVYGAARGHAAIDTRVAQQVARLLVSNDPTRIHAAMQLLGQPRMLGHLRNADAALASIAARGTTPSLAN